MFLLRPRWKTLSYRGRVTFMFCWLLLTIWVVFMVGLWKITHP
jgi:hypothetical protein